MEPGYSGYNGLMAEWLGKGLQNLVQRFESASDLTETVKKPAEDISRGFFNTSSKC